MKLPTTLRYATRAITQLASAYPGRPVSVREVAEQQRISPKYLEQILKPLSAAGLVRAVRGKQGGYLLGRPAQTITLKDVFETLEGSAAPVDCVDFPDSCPMHDTCPTRETWVEIKQAIESVLGWTTIQDLVARMRRKAVSSAPVQQN